MFVRIQSCFTVAPSAERNMSNILCINFTNSHFHYTDHNILYLGHETTYNAHVPLLPLPFIYSAYSAINALIYYVYYAPINFQLVNSTQYFQIITRLITSFNLCYLFSK